MNKFVVIALALCLVASLFIDASDASFGSSRRRRRRRQRQRQSGKLHGEGPAVENVADANEFHDEGDFPDGIEEPERENDHAARPKNYGV